MNPTLKAALAYQKLGWSVIPVSSSSKKPLIEWAEFQKRRATPKEIRQWWKVYPSANVGVVTGNISGLVVVDVDTDRGGDPKKLFTDSPANHIVKTGSGGYHFYYQRPADLAHVPNQVGKSSGLDVRADGGYVVAPPSRHISGNLYAWDRGNEGVPLLPPPEFALSKRNTSNGNGTHSEPWLAETLRGVSHGGRNDACARLAGYYQSKGMPKDVALESLILWNTKNEPPLPRSEIVTTVDSVWRTVDRRESQAGQERQRGQDAPQEPFAVVGFGDYMTQYGGMEVPWLVEDWLPDSTIAMAVAPPGTYKTWLELDLAVAVASGAPFLGKYPVRRTGPVIIIQQEDFHGQMAERMSLIVSSRLDLPHAGVDPDGTFVAVTPPQLPIYLHPDRRFRFNDSVVLEALAQKIEEIRPVLVIIDPLYSTGSTDDYMASTVQEMFFLKNMRDKYDCSFLISHHTKKKSLESDREDAWGSQFLNAFIETGWQVRPKDKPGTASIRRHFKVRPNKEEAILTFHIKTEGHWHYSVDLQEVEAGKIGKEEPDLLATLAERGPLTPTDLAKLLGLHRSSVSRRLVKLVEIGSAVEVKGGRYACSADIL